MSNTKTVMSQAANTLVTPPVNVEDVFSTYLYDGTGSTQTITNGIDLDGKGGLVWTKMRSDSQSHRLWDTERGDFQSLQSDKTDASENNTNSLSFNSDGFSLGDSAVVNYGAASDTYASWTFRKAPKFFDVVTWTGDGVAGRAIPHNLGSVPACIIIKNTALGTNWIVYHSGADSTSPEDYYFYLDSTNARIPDATMWDSTAPTSTTFTVGSDNAVNRATDLNTYVAYLFAHNDGDGGFGPDGDADIIKCGSYTGNGSLDGNFIDLGWEPQWVMVKNTDLAAESWVMLDNMRGVTGGNDPRLVANGANSEAFGQIMEFNATGFTPLTADDKINGSGHPYIYIAIRRGTKVPESGTEVFNVTHRGTTEATNNNVNFYAGFPIDTAWQTDNKTSAFGLYFTTRLTGGNTYLYPHSTAAESGVQASDDMQNNWGKNTGTNTENTNAIAWMWKRAPKFFDVVAYGPGNETNRVIPHNLGVAPEMMWVFTREGGINRVVYHKGLNGGVNPEQYGIVLNTSGAEFSYSTGWNDTAPTDAGFTVGTHSSVNQNGQNYIAYLFASLDGVSKVGSYTGDGTNDGSKVIDCGFTSGARFVLIKRTDSASDWFVFDTARGIVAASDDPALRINTTNAEDLANYIEPSSSGFALKGALNQSGGNYIFYAVA